MRIRRGGTRRGTVVLGLAAALLSGCVTTSSPPSAPPYSPVDGRWVQVPESPLTARNEATGAWVDDRFVVVGGWDGPVCGPGAGCRPPVDPALSDGAGFDPTTGQWTPIADAPVPVSSSNSVVIGSSLFVLTGESDREDSPVAFLRWDAHRDSWSRLPLPPDPRARLASAGGQVLATSSSDQERQGPDSVFDPVIGGWRSLPEDPLGRSTSRGVTWMGDRLLLAATPTPLPDANVEGRITRLAWLDRSLSRWTVLPPAEALQGDPVAVNGLAVFGSFTFDGEAAPEPRPFGYGRVLDLDTLTWQAVPNAPQGRGVGCYGLAVGDRICLWGHLFEPRSRQWTPVPSPPQGDRTSTTFLASPDTLFVWGGSTDQANTAEGYVLQNP